jgi:hypothetical protein
MNVERVAERGSSCAKKNINLAASVRYTHCSLKRVPYPGTLL